MNLETLVAANYHPDFPDFSTEMLMSKAADVFFNGVKLNLNAAGGERILIPKINDELVKIYRDKNNDIYITIDNAVEKAEIKHLQEG